MGVFAGIAALTATYFVTSWILKNKKNDELIRFELRDQIHTIKERVENYSRNHHDFPKSLEAINVNADTDRLKFWLADEGIIKSTLLDANGNSIDITIKPSYQQKYFTWSCKASSHSSLLPIACHTQKQWSTGAKLFNSKSGLGAIYAPYDWSYQKLNDAAHIQLCDKHKLACVLVISELKNTLDGMAYGNYARHTLSHLKSNQESSGKESPPIALTIAGRPALQHRFEARVNQQNFNYLHTIIDGPQAMHQVLAWNVPDRNIEYVAVLEKITESFREDVNLNKESFSSFAYYSDGSYEGEMVSGQPQGKGSFQWLNGDLAKGDFGPNGPEGLIRFEWDKDGDYKGYSCDGEVREGSFNGEIRCEWPGGRFKGTVKDALANGKGKITWDSEALIVGLSRRTNTWQWYISLARW